MTEVDLEELVSQAEEEGVTLAEVISKRLSSEELDDLQRKLQEELASSYGRIEGFMREIVVPSISDVMGICDFEELGAIVDGALSMVDSSDDFSSSQV